MAVPDEVRQSIEEQGGVEALARQLPDAERLRAESRRFHTLSDPIRLSILHLLATQPLCVCVIKDVLHVPDSKLSYHLSVLQSSGLIRGERQANWIVYHETSLGRQLIGLVQDLARLDQEGGTVEPSSANV
ncbi:MAG: metalloregulator ArsR/SmtB family transcription factor [Methanospirillum sp.]